MKNRILFFAAALISISVAARAAEVNFDGAKAGSADSFLDVAAALADIASGNHSGPGNDHGQPQQPGNHGGPGHDNNHGQPGHDNNHPGNNDWNNDHNGPGHHDNHPLPYAPVYEGMNCRSMEFTSQSPNSVTHDMIVEEQSYDCYMNGSTQYCRPTGKYLSRKVTVNVGPRKLESFEKETLDVCLDNFNTASLKLDGMLYQYAVASQDHDGFFGGRSTTFDLTPGAKKPSNPDGKELSVSFAGLTTAGEIHMTLTDSKAAYFAGGRITITADGMRLGTVDPDAPIQDVLDSFVQFKVTNTFDVAGSYDLKLMDKPKPGKYVVTLSFFRAGANASGASASTMEMFEVK